jgi:hypothetical protein
MYRDIERLRVIKADDAHVRYWYGNKPNLITIGHEHYKPRPDINFDVAFYNQMGVPFTQRWDKFYVARDLDREKELFDKLNLSPNNYIFLHDDPSRGLVIDRTHIENKDLAVFTPSMCKTDNIFDYLSIMHNATEVHCMDSSFKLMFDSISNIDKTPKLFYHINLMDGVIKDHTNISSNKLIWKLI